MPLIVRTTTSPGRAVGGPAVIESGAGAGASPAIASRTITAGAAMLRRIAATASSLDNERTADADRHVRHRHSVQHLEIGAHRPRRRGAGNVAAARAVI